MDSEAPKALSFKDEEEVEVLAPEFVEDMTTAKRAL